MGILDLLFPKKCLECGIEGKYICGECLKKVPVNRWQEGNYSIFAYQGVIRKAIIALKYKFATEIAKELVEVSLRHLHSIFNVPHSTYLIPIPMYKYKENFRGFNQAALIGEKLAEKMNWQFTPNLLVKTAPTPPQVGLKGTTRHQNLQNVFAVNSSHNTYNIMHNTIVLFDDVYTTGSTIREAKKVLEKAGFKNIQALTIAR